MDRLTTVSSDTDYLDSCRLKHQDICDTICDELEKKCPFEAIANRLAKYEDTNLTPEQITKYKSIEENCGYNIGEAVHNLSAEILRLKDELQAYIGAEEQGLLFDITNQHDLEGTKRIIHSLIEQYIGAPVPKELIDTAIDNLVMQERN